MMVVGLGASRAADRALVTPTSPAPSATLPSATMTLAPTAVAPPPRPVATTVAATPVPQPKATKTPNALSACAGQDSVPPLPKLAAACDSNAEHERVTLIFVTDMHAHVHRYLPGGRSPLGVLRAYVARRRIETGGRVVFLDGGDDLEKGSLFDARSEGAATIHLLDHLGLDVRMLGNHDFAYGTSSVLAQTTTQAFPVLASNVDGPPGFAAKRTVQLQVGCTKIGLFGLLVPPYDERDEPHDGPYLSEFHVHRDPDGRYPKLAEGFARELRAGGADVVIALNHLGMARDRPIIDEAPSVDVVLSGHDHFHIGGPLHGKHGFLYDGGSFLAGQGDANGEAHVDEIVLAVDRVSGVTRVRLEKTTSHRLADLPDLDVALEAEVQRMQDCFAKDALTPIADLARPMRAAEPDVWTTVVDAALVRRFPHADAWLYERASYGGIAKTDLSEGPVTAQDLANFSYVEKQRAGGPGFTAMVPVSVSGQQLRAICAAKTHTTWNLRVQRHCPPQHTLVDDSVYTLLVQRRTLYAPTRAFSELPAGFPSAGHADHDAVEIRDLLIEHARARGAACLMLDRDQPAPCRPTST